MVLRIFFSLIFGYFLGSISSAYLIAKLVKGVDIRRVGTGNPGAANVFREVGKPWGILVWVFDTAKGAVAMFVAAKLTNNFPKPAGIWILFLALVGVVAIAGHCWPIFLSFKGGKGAATSGGVILYLVPWLLPLVLILFFLIQKKGPRSPKLLLLSIIVFFVFLFLIPQYRASSRWLVPSIFLLIGIGALANISAVKEIRR